MVSPEQAIRMEDAIKSIVARDEYPSAARISRELGRRCIVLNGFEVKLRREIFNRLGIQKIRTGAPPGNTNASGRRSR